MLPHPHHTHTPTHQPPTKKKKNRLLLIHLPQLNSFRTQTCKYINIYIYILNYYLFTYFHKVITKKKPSYENALTSSPFLPFIPSCSFSLPFSHIHTHTHTYIYIYIYIYIPSSRREGEERKKKDKQKVKAKIKIKVKLNSFFKKKKEIKQINHPIHSFIQWQKDNPITYNIWNIIYNI
ncbi:hypothetical protein, conserved [Trypanosoma brucei brucei TREU927]|uniref:Uncharacterized protein n=1 Tax=Trypanosoma brucei brucei (strain 927/4 GUTat10.1) TaxID=185431 RepID=Q38D84_TRYB2|nr:hypothetical protein, conserved [Trypanosoma brucei brucei TREU927]EAN77236.1 hypothetical protein, conserved [Trypanosoma brucei brucei TREU927]